MARPRTTASRSAKTPRRLWLTLAANDGSSPAAFFEPLPAATGAWQPTPSCPVNAATGLRVGISLSGRAHGTVGYPEPIGLPAGASAVDRQLPLLHGSARGDERRGRGEHGAARPIRADVARVYNGIGNTYGLRLIAPQLVAGPRRRPRAERAQLRTDRDGRQRRVHRLRSRRNTTIASGGRRPRSAPARTTGISGRRATRRSFRSSRRPAFRATLRTTPAAAAPASR